MEVNPGSWCAGLMKVEKIICDPQICSLQLTLSWVWKLYDDVGEVQERMVSFKSNMNSIMIVSMFYYKSPQTTFSLQVLDRDWEPKPFFLGQSDWCWNNIWKVAEKTLEIICAKTSFMLRWVRTEECMMTTLERVEGIAVYIFWDYLKLMNCGDRQYLRNQLRSETFPLSTEATTTWCYTIQTSH